MANANGKWQMANTNGATISASTTERPNTLGALFYYLRPRKQGKGWTERPGSSRLVSSRLASPRLLPSGFGEIAQIGPGRPRMKNNTPAHLLGEQKLCNIRDSHRRTRRQSLAILALGNIGTHWNTHPSPHLISHGPWAYSYLNLIRLTSNQSQLLSGLPTAP